VCWISFIITRSIFFSVCSAKLSEEKTSAQVCMDYFKNTLQHTCSNESSLDEVLNSSKTMANAMMGDALSHVYPVHRRDDRTLIGVFFLPGPLHSPLVPPSLHTPILSLHPSLSLSPPAVSKKAMDHAARTSHDRAPKALAFL
jgi:hypothetical protein